MFKNLKSSRNRPPVAVRLSKDEHELAKVLAKSHGSISQVLRDGLLDYSKKIFTTEGGLKSSEHDKSQKGMSPNDVEAAFATIKITSIELSRLQSELLSRLEKHEKFWHLCFYTLLYHFPAIEESMKPEAYRSAMERKRRLMALLNDEEITQ